MDTRPDVRLYVCDPVKNKDCKKTSCIHNPDAKDRSCRATHHPEFAATDENGQPMLLPLPLFKEEKRNA